MKIQFLILAAVIFLFSCKQETSNYLFSEIDPSESGLHFENILRETDSLNIVTYLYFYNGGGVAIGDLNNDKLPDVVLTSNQASDKIFLNRGELKFSDVTNSSGIDTAGLWSTGVTITDVNQDGWNDIYICRVGNYLGLHSQNSLYINQKDGTFIDEAEAYGLDFSGFSTQANFFDYDNDGDLDCYLLNHSIKNPGVFSQATVIRGSTDARAGDVLFQNDNGYFRNVNEQANIYSSPVGFGLGITTADFNRDGWQDIYVGNDFHENDYLYINQKDGTFVEVAEQVFGHTSNFTMGVAAQDLDNNGLIDIFSCDMMPDNEEVFKKSGGWENIEIYNFKRSYGYHHQSPRNAFQSNTGSPHFRFSEQAAYYGLHASDWSWSPIIADFDGNGENDLFISNGIVKRPNDMDFVNYMSDSNKDLDDSTLISLMPSGAERNRLYAQSDGKFTEVKIGNANMTTGAAIGDLDGDGDLDLILNNVNAKAGLLINNSDPVDYTRIYLTTAVSGGNQVQYQGGATVDVFVKDRKITWNSNNATGFQSCNQSLLLIPESYSNIDSIRVIYGNKQTGSTQLFTCKSADCNLTLSNPVPNAKTSVGSLAYTLSSKDSKLQLINDQSKEKLLTFNYANPPKRHIGFKAESPSLLEYSLVERLLDSPDVTSGVVTDLNNDGVQDAYFGRKRSQDNALIALRDGLFLSTQDSFMQIPQVADAAAYTTSVVKANDFDLEGDVDLFVGICNSFIEGEERKKSMLLINNGKGMLAPSELDVMGAVTDAQWLDLDNNGQKDLVVVGHWMPITIFYFEGKGVRKQELSNSVGMWNTIELCGDKLLLGNVGLNHRLRSLDLKLIITDINRDSRAEYIMAYVKDGELFSYHNFETLLSKFPMIRKSFSTHASFADVNLRQILSELKITNYETIDLDHQRSSYIELDGSYEIQPLPDNLQKGAITTIASVEKDRVVFAGNSSAFDPNWGRQDGFFPQLTSLSSQFTLIKQFPEIGGEIMDITTSKDSIMFHSRDFGIISIARSAVD